jgi:type II secretory pathway pseudopilin PulG
MNIQTRNTIISLVLGAIIIVLGYMLYDSIVTPYQEVVEKQRMEERVQERMSDLRDVLIQYKSRNGDFPAELDSVITFLKTDSIMTQIADSMFTDRKLATYKPDSVVFSPRPPHKHFNYMLNDTLRPKIYFLQDPDNPENYIGDSLKTTMLNAASWE